MLVNKYRKWKDVLILSRKLDRKDDNRKKWGAYNVKVGVLVGIFTLIGGTWTFSESLSNLFFPEKITEKVTSYDNSVYQFQNAERINPNKERSNQETLHYLVSENQTFIKNDSNKNILINKGVLLIEDFEELKHTEIVLQQGLYKEYLELYFINNGNLESEPLTFQLDMTFSKQQQGVLKEENIDSERMQTLINEEKIKKSEFAGGQIKRMYHINTSGELKKFFRENPNYTSVNFKLREKKSGNEFNVYSIYYLKEQDKFVYGGFGGVAPNEQYNVIELDLDNMEREQEIPNVNMQVPAHSSVGIKTLLVPKKSIRLTYKINYYFEGNKVEYGDLVSTEIYVPLYNIRSNLYGELFDKLCQYSITNYTYEETTKMQNSIKYDYKYVYKLFEENR
ncbi:hypothetical protein [Enterococcus rivorum]|uniref:Uncharacterized protein n=2 Tax=Enterococcus rivorum TaxID=762845 RepID=A0A1E5KZ15_9ENTE|nr:hypothetical protein [Enterococcus rivorum]MBP2097690.1 hypothetical protein [Enterococcus rivorum]OEH83126.1 hypothetical protein BCR26_02330 [Enterococcus rivorum]